LEERENDALSQIYKQYQNEGQDIGRALMAVQSAPGISPTKRVNVANQLLQYQKQNNVSQNNILKQQETNAKNLAEQQKSAEEEARNIEYLKQSGASDREIAAYNAAPVGGKTEVIKNIVENQQRKEAPAGFINEGIEDFDKGLTPKERVKRQDQRFTTQTPLVNKNSEGLHALESEDLSLNLLEELDETEKVGEGLHNLNINPLTGSLFVPKVATPEEQLFVKTVNDFTVKAKDSFGARVTNFELDRFMQRLPTLANSQAGRRLIIGQMRIVNQINQLEKRALQDVFDQYGIRNIDYADAENIARKKINDQKNELKKEYLSLEQLAKKEDAELIANIKRNVQEGYSPLRKPDGSIKQFPTKNVPNLLEKGYKEL
jgi:hypothetical protein